MSYLSSTNSTLPELELNHKLFLDRVSLYLGASGSGKSTVMSAVMYELRNYIDQIVCFSPTDRQNNNYSKGLVPLPCIHYQITEKILIDIWERQEVLCFAYAKVNDKTVLRSLFDKVPNNGAYKNTIESLSRKLKESCEELKRSNDATSGVKIQEMEASCGKLITMFIKRCIEENTKYLQGLNLSETERFAVRYISLNPRILIIFDDCTDQIKKLKSHPIIQKIFYQGRWNYITCLICAHTDKVFDPELKKNAFITIFTEPTSAAAYFTRGSNDLTKEERKRAENASKIAFANYGRDHQKLAWVREESVFKKFTAERHDSFQFGNQFIWKYCDKIKADPGKTVVNNKFASLLK